MKIAVTGGNGFVGSHLIPALLRQRHEVRLLVRTKTALPRGVVSIVGDVSSAATMSRFLNGSDIVVNLIGRFDPPFDEQVESNVSAPFYILSAAGALGIQRIIHISAAAVYGDLAIAKIPTETDPIDPNTPYGLSKALGEEIVRYCQDTYGVASVILRPTNIYGADARVGVLQSMAKSVKDSGTISITGDGEQIRDFIHVEDLVSAIVSIIAKPPGGKLYNISSGMSLTLNDLASLFVTTSRKPVRIIHTQEAKGHVRSLRADNSRLIHDYSWQPRYTIRETISEIIK